MIGPHSSRAPRLTGGFVLLETLAVAAILFAVVASALGIYFAGVAHARDAAEETECEMLALSIESAFRAGAEANLRADGRSFHFVFEGVAVFVSLPQVPGTAGTIPPAGEPWLYPAGTLRVLPDGILERSGRFRGAGAGGVERVGSPVYEAAVDLDRDGIVLQDEDTGDDGLPNPLEPGATGPDGGYGVAGVDDDGDGVVDDVFEYLSPGSDDVFDPRGDDFHPTRNPLGTEGDGILGPGESDRNGNGYLDSPPRSRPTYQRDAGATAAPARFAAMLRREPSRDYGYRLRVRRAGPIGRADIPAGAGPAYRVTIEIYPGFSESRRRLRENARRGSGDPAEPLLPLERVREWQFVIRFK
jgi:type II secretory pathway pseudopilin PulG